MNSVIEIMTRNGKFDTFNHEVSNVLVEISTFLTTIYLKTFERMYIKPNIEIF